LLIIISVIQLPILYLPFLFQFSLQHKGRKKTKKKQFNVQRQMTESLRAYFHLAESRLITKSLLAFFSFIHRYETLDGVSSFSSPRTPRIQPGQTNMFSSSIPSMSNLGYGSTLYEVADSRPKTAPIPPTLESPRANPRITSAKPPPLPRGQSKSFQYLLYGRVFSDNVCPYFSTLVIYCEEIRPLIC